MQADFLDAHQRHWDDAEHLFQAQRWANADHLYGVATECGLKSLMKAFGMPHDAATGSPNRRDDRQHANSLWARYESYRSGHNQGAAYILPASNPFHDWDVSQRYSNRSNFDQARAQSHKTGAQIVCGLIKRAQRAGIV